MKSPLAQILWASALPFAVAWLHIPLQLYYFNQLDLGYDLGLVGVLAMLGLGLLVPCWLVLAMLAWRRPRAAAVAAAGLMLAGLGMFAADLFAPLSLHALDGTELTSPEPLILTLLEGAIWLGLAGLGWRWRAKGLLPLAGWLLGLLLLLDLGFLGLAWGQKPASPAPPAAVARPQPSLATPGAKGRPNIYHLVLDALQTDFFLHYLQENQKFSAYPGFTLFEQSHSHYPYTLFSMTSVMTSSLYQQGSSVDWVDRRYEGLPKEAKANGYRWTSMAKNRFHTPYDDVSVDSELLFLRKSFLKHPQMVDFYRLSLARSLPNPWTNEALAAGKTAGLKLADWLNQDQAGKSLPRTVNDGMEPYAGVILLRHAKETEAQRQPQGEYLFLHPIIPHGPYVMDEECRYHPPQPQIEAESLSQKRVGYAKQVACAARLVEEFLQQLQALGRYDDSLIVIHGDHGEGFVGVWELDAAWQGDAGANRVFRPEMMNWEKHQVEARSLAALLVKPPQAKGALQVSRQDAQLLDIYPTIRQQMGWPQQSHLQGRSLFAAEQPRRERPFFFFKTTQGRFQLSDVERFEVPLGHRFSDFELVSQGRLTLTPQRPLRQVELVDLATLGLSLEGFSGADQKDGVTFVTSLGGQARISLPFLLVERPLKVELELQLAGESNGQVEVDLQGQIQILDLAEGWQTKAWEARLEPHQPVTLALRLPGQPRPALRFARLRLEPLP